MKLKKCFVFPGTFMSRKKLFQTIGHEYINGRKATHLCKPSFLIIINIIELALEGVSLYVILINTVKMSINNV